MDLIDISKELVNGENMGSIAQVVYFGKHADVATWPTRPSAPATIADNGALVGDLIMKPGKKLFSFYLTDDTGEFRIEPVGETDGKSNVLRLTVFHPGLSEKILGFANEVQNENLVFIVPDNNGAKFLMGDELRPAFFSGPGPGQGTGTETAGRRGMGFEFAYKTGKVFQYKGAVPLTEASSS